MPAVVPITQATLPRFVTSDEHKQLTASTPTSFGDIPPVLRYTQTDVQITFEPPIPELESTDRGTLYVIESTLAFIWPSGIGFTVEYPRITLHAVSRGEAGPSVYCQLDESDPTANGRAEDDEDEEDSAMREMKIIPSDPASIEPIFEALSQCAALHPDPEDVNWPHDADLDGETGFPDEEELDEVGKAALAHLESLILFPEDEEDEEEAPIKEALQDADESHPSEATSESKPTATSASA